MRTILALILLAFIFGLPVVHAQPGKDEFLFQPEDQRLAEQKMHDFSSRTKLPLADLVAEIGLTFLGTPYVAATLENGLEEKLVINLRELDCTTFAENCLALAYTVKLGKTDFASFVSQLEKIRYRNGLRNRYPSRLHYFSEWIMDNHHKQIINASINEKGVKMGKAIRFMSTHPNSYPVLKQHPGLVSVIAEQEEKLSLQPLYYFPKENLQNMNNHLQHGDIIGLTSAVEGLDINHVGIVISHNGNFQLLHASQGAKKVVLSDTPVSDFLQPGSKNSGIMIARPVFHEEQIVP